MRRWHASNYSGDEFFSSLKQLIERDMGVCHALETSREFPCQIGTSRCKNLRHWS